MRLFVLAFAGGIWLLQQQAALPDFSWMAGLAGGAVLLFGLSRWLLKLWAAESPESALAARRFVASALLAAACCAFRRSMRRR